MKKIFGISLLILACFSCREVYNPPVVASPNSYLVVEGFINSTDTTIITLSRTLNIADTTAVQYEHGAIVTVEGNNSETYSLFESGSGTYSGIFNLTPGNEYRLHIRTNDGKEYASGYMPVRYTPAIDSISWQHDSSGVQIFANTHSNQNDTGYYLWNYTETWEFHAAYASSLMYVYDGFSTIPAVLDRPLDSRDSLFYCWKTQNSSNIILGSSEKLTEDRILQPVRFIPKDAEELTVLYFIKLKQYSISKDAYQFFQRLQKNTEQVGTIFDAQPSQLIGNIKCLSNPGEMVVGYVDIAQKQEKNIFISNAEVAPWVIPPACALTTIFNKNEDLIAYRDYTPVSIVETRGLGFIYRFSVSANECVDCRLRGTHEKPSFWP